MSLLGIVLILLSAITHAVWNLFSKASGAPMSFLYRALVWSAALYLPLFVVTQLVAPFPWQVWVLVAISGGLCGVYFIALCKAYDHGEVSFAYPIARSFPLMIVAWAGLFLGEHPSHMGLGGIALIVGGCFVLPYRRFCIGPDGFCRANYLNRSAFWALVAAVLTSIYSVLDKVAAREMLPPAQFWPSMCQRAGYVYVQNAVSLAVMAWFLRRTRHAVQPLRRAPVILCALIFLISYLLVMVTLARDPVSYSLALRQFSILIAAVVSMFWLEKDFSWPRLTGVLAIVAGVVLVSLS